MKRGTSSRQHIVVIRIAAALSSLFVAAFWVPIAIAGAVNVVGYDVTETPLSHFGCWSHTYTGTITPIGRTVIGCGSDPAVPVANYSDGSGTLNDGVIATSVDGNQLFTLTSYDGGAALNPSITLRLAVPSAVDHIDIHGGDDPGSVAPGPIDGVTVEVGGIAVTLSTTPFGVLNFFGVPVNDRVSLAGSVLEGVVADRIVLRDFTAAFAFESLFSITEIRVFDAVSAAPEPSSFLVTSIALLMFAIARRGFRRRPPHCRVHHNVE